MAPVRFFILLLAIALGACTNRPPVSTSDSTTPIASIAARSLAPGGTLRAAINFGNPILVAKDPATGAPRGVSVDLATELGRRLGVPVQFVLYDAAGKVVEGLKAGEWDIGFYAIDPVRGIDTDFSGPYVVIEGAYLVTQDSSIRDRSDVDRKGNRVVVATGSAYDLYLTRELKAATLIRVSTSQAVVDSMLTQSAEVSAGVRQQLESDQKRLPGLRMLEGRFMSINQAMGVPKGRAEGVRYLSAYVEEMKASGFVAESLRRHGIQGAAVAPPLMP